MQLLVAKFINVFNFFITSTLQNKLIKKEESAERAKCNHAGTSSKIVVPNKTIKYLFYELYNLTFKRSNFGYVNVKSLSKMAR